MKNARCVAVHCEKAVQRTAFSHRPRSRDNHQIRHFLRRL